MAHVYESARSRNEYLLFHYGTDDEILPWHEGPQTALGFAVRTVSELIDVRRPLTRALDVGCATGRSSFELARHCNAVVGVDFSESFVAAATRLRDAGFHDYERTEEGELFTPLVARVPEDIDRERVRFETGDATDLRADLGSFDVVHAANLIDRLPKPMRFLERLPGLVNPGGQLLLASPFTWLEEFTPRSEWLGGLMREGQPVRTSDALRELLVPYFELDLQCDLPFLIREHARKYQWSVACGTRWIRR